MLMHAATFLTVVMARERYLAISDPTGYRNATLMSESNMWRKPILYLAGAVVASSVFVFPINWEAEVRERNRTVTMDDNTTVLEVR